MTSWRDSASPQAQDDLDGLLGEALPFAEQMLEQHGEFFPYAVALHHDGEPRMIAGDPGQGDQPESADVIALLVDGLRADRAALRAAAVVSDVRLADTDAVRVELEHVEGHTIAVFLPYRTKRFRGGVEFSALRAGSATAQIWIS